MNAGPTSLRVYTALKARIVSGDFLSGERLDPVDLASELAASVTPVRDCLHRLIGERLIENWDQAGFRMPLMTEADLRDIFGWSAELMDAACRACARVLPPGKAKISTVGMPVERLAERVFEAIAAATRNAEIRATISQLNDRLGVYRHAEAAISPDQTEITILATAVSSERWGEVRVLLRTYHRRRIRMIPALVEFLRSREPKSH